MKNIGIIICTRTDSTRIPKKVFQKINGLTIIEHLLNRLIHLKIKIVLAVPQDQAHEYDFLKSKYENIIIYSSVFKDDPLNRMNEAAIANNIDHIIRITHDKILIDYKEILNALIEYETSKCDYLYSSKFIDGTSFEIISQSIIQKAALKYKNVEFISYAVRAETDNIYFYRPRQEHCNSRFLIDFKEDLEMFELLFTQLGNDATLKDCINYLNNNPEFKKINNYPDLTIYTCVYNGEQYLESCIISVTKQKDFKSYEYLIIDDCSTDSSFAIAKKYSLQYPNIRVIRNEKNLGLASSSNIALINAKGKYITRLDHDDYYFSGDSIKSLLKYTEDYHLEVCYPDNYYGSFETIQKGNQDHHVGGAMFEKKAINFIKFMDGLRHYEGLDFFIRAKDKLKIGYYKKPIFFYRQRSDSMSRTDLQTRKKIKEEILNFNYHIEEHKIHWGK